MIEPTVPKNAIAKLMWEDARKFIVKASDISASQDTQRRLSEQIFIQHFLPFFAGEIEPEHIDEMRTIWIDVAGDVFTEVSIIGEGGVVVAIVPSLGDRNSIRLTTSDEKERMSSVTLTARQKMTISPILSDNIITNALEEKFMVKDVTDNNIAKRKEWEKLLNKYGRSLDGKTKAVIASESANHAHNVTDDDFE